MTDLRLPEWAADVLDAGSSVPEFTLRDWWVVEQDGVTTIQFRDGRTLDTPASVETFVRSQEASLTNSNNLTKENTIMPSTQANFTDESAEEVTGLIEFYQNPPMLFIGQGARSAAAVNSTKKPWMNLMSDRDLVIGRVTLDTEPEQPGRPIPGRPGVRQIVFLCLPDWHPAFKENVQEVCALVYEPVSTYDATIQDGGRVYTEPRASSFDTVGLIGVAKWFGDLESAESERADLWRAVQAHSKTGEARDEADTDVDLAAGRFGKLDTWGL